LVPLVISGGRRSHVSDRHRREAEGGTPPSEAPSTAVVVGARSEGAIVPSVLGQAAVRGGHESCVSRR